MNQVPFMRVISLAHSEYKYTVCLLASSIENYYLDNLYRWKKYWKLKYHAVDNKMY